MVKAVSEERASLIRLLMLILAALLIFGGPTYAIYVLRHIANLPYILAVSIGLIALIVGIWLFLRLTGKQTKLGVHE